MVLELKTCYIDLHHRYIIKNYNGGHMKCMYTKPVFQRSVFVTQLCHTFFEGCCAGLRIHVLFFSTWLITQRNSTKGKSSVRHR
jgi:hypothetical protein